MGGSKKGTNMKQISKLALTLVAVCGLSAAPASATYYLQAGSGHPHMTTGAYSWRDVNNADWFEIIDGRTIELAVPSAGNTIIRGWDTPIPVTSTGVKWNASAQGWAANADWFTNRICTFNSDGSFAYCGAAQPLNTTSTALVPSGGSAYGQSSIRSVCIAGGYCGLGSILYTIRAW